MTATTEPLALNAGDTLAWRKTLADYPASAGWVLAYVLLSAAQRFTITAVADGATHAISVPAATTATYNPGTYTWVATVTKGAERYTIRKGTLQIAPDLAAAGTATFDARTSARKALDAANSALENYGNKAYLQGFEIAGRKQQFHTPGEFLSYRAKLVAEVAREDNAARIASGLQATNFVGVRFTTR